MEPERYAENIPIRKKHPEWFVPGWSRIRMENPDARNYVVSEIERLIETYKLAWLKFDHNASLGYDETGAELFNYYSAWHEALDGLRRKYPQTVFENCSSGAMRHDLSSLFHFDVHFASDNVNPMDVLRISQGGLLRMPPGRILHWAAPMPAPRLPLTGYPTEARHVLTPCGATWNTAETAELDFLTIAAMFGVLGFSGDLQSLENPDRKRLHWYIDFYKKWRRMILTSVCHLLTPVRPLNERAGWTVIQLQSPETSAGIIFHFYKPNDGQERRLVQLRNLEPETVYRVRRINPDGQTEQKIKGDQLMRTGLKLSEPYFMHSVFKAGITTVEPFILK
ncbi:MAG: alpha-galactosidase [Kiritimatiellia bacterium]|nr:alpha-galactosidase [Kiritimatiellia bacterium]